ncbi:hypothetical protein ACFY0F_23580 [Streptomyces sp. NPDC001544]|uniref:hypothetical protein n=1 Tax=Streptomyces sp. NPDC001544 TaxID=3364584 RepID=UPI003678F2E1
MTAVPVEKKINGHEPRFDPRALAEAEAIRTRAAAEAECARIKAQGEADAARTLAAEQAEELRLANERKRMRLEKDQADHDAYLAKKAAEAAKAKADGERTKKAEAEQAERDAQAAAEQERSERYWKWGARAIYAVGLLIAAPVQFLDFWDPHRKFLIAAPALLEGFALVLACGAAWAVAHRRDVLPYRIGIMLGAAIAATINLRGGMTNPDIGFNAGLIGAIASLGGPIVLMAYEHGIAQKADGIPSWREKRAVDRAKAEADAAREKARAEKKAAEEKAAAEKAEQQRRVEEEQKRKDADRKSGHEQVWKIAEAMRSARGSAVVTEQIWADAWYRVTGSKVVGITPEIEELTQSAQWRMKAVADAPIKGPLSLVDSQIKRHQKRDPEAPDGRRNNGGTPPVRRAGDTQPYSEGARRQIGRETAARKAEEKSE